jgi:hypothetical protein
MTRITMLTLSAILAAGATSCADPGTTATTGALVAPSDPDSLRLRDILLNTNEYSLTHWYQARGYHTQTGRYLVLGDGRFPWQDSHPNSEHRVRAAGSVALALAVSLELGVYDPVATTVPQATAEARALTLIRSIAYRHRANSDGGWGGSWQSPLWALYAGTAGWLMHDRLDATDRDLVRRMIEDEARRLIGTPVPYYRNDRDEVISPGDSKAEENAWNAQFLVLAVNMFPDHPTRTAWEYKAAELAVSAHASVVDRSDGATVVGGRSLRSWLRGSNVERDGSVVNHDIVHPDYMATAAYSASAPIWYGLAEQPTPDAMFAGAPRVYAALVDRVWPSGPYEPPGGTIYIDDSGSLYFPQGTDWGDKRRINYVLFDVVARHFELDGDVVAKAHVWERLHAEAALALQARSSDGRTYVDSSEDAYASREEWVAAHAALSYLATWIVTEGRYSRSAAFIPVVLDNRDREVQLTGSWTSDRPFDRLGDNNVYANPGGSSGARRATWRMASPLPAGRYRVAAWWSAHPTHASDAPYTVVHAAGSTVIRVDQRFRGGTWNELGAFDFDGTSATGIVELWNRTSTGTVVADGIRLERL